MQNSVVMSALKLLSLNFEKLAWPYIKGSREQYVSKLDIFRIKFHHNKLHMPLFYQCIFCVFLLKIISNTCYMLLRYFHIVHKNNMCM